MTGAGSSGPRCASGGSYPGGVPSFGTVVAVIIAVIAFLLIWKVGIGLLRSLGTPLPPPPPEGELRRVNVRYRCSLCGTELRMTLATNELPVPPRHCMEDMDVVKVME